MNSVFLSVLNQMNQLSENMQDSPHFRMLKGLWQAFAADFGEQDASKIVASMEIDVSEAFVEDTELVNLTIKTYAKMMRELKNSLDSIHPSLFWEVIRQPNKITLKCNE